MDRVVFIILLGVIIFLIRGEDLICSNRFRNSSRLNDIAIQKGVHRISKSRANAVHYDQVGHQGYQGNDQGSNHHDYLFTYEREFNGLPKNLIGVLDGHSLRNFADFFGSDATIVGFDVSLQLFKDISASPQGTRPNIRVYEGDSTLKESWTKLRADFPDGFHLIIDDGCHTPLCLKRTLEYGWPLLRFGGIYLGEDSAPLPNIVKLIHDLNGINPRKTESKYRSADAIRNSMVVSRDSIDTITFGRGFWILTKYLPHAP